MLGVATKSVVFVMRVYQVIMVLFVKIDVLKTVCFKTVQKKREPVSPAQMAGQETAVNAKASVWKRTNVIPMEYVLNVPMDNTATIVILNVQRTVTVVAIEPQDTAIDASQTGMESNAIVQECAEMVAVKLQRVFVMNVRMVTTVMTVLAGVHRTVMVLDVIGMTIPARDVVQGGTWRRDSAFAVVTAVIMVAI